MWCSWHKWFKSHCKKISTIVGSTACMALIFWFKHGIATWNRINVFCWCTNSQRKNLIVPRICIRKLLTWKSPFPFDWVWNVDDYIKVHLIRLIFILPSIARHLFFFFYIGFVAPKAFGPRDWFWCRRTLTDSQKKLSENVLTFLWLSLQITNYIEFDIQPGASYEFSLP